MPRSPQARPTLVPAVDERAQAAIGDTLLEAYRTRQPVEPLTETFPDIDLEDAYAIQQHQVRWWLAAGAVLGGHKVGLTSAAMQRQMGVDQPDFGVLRDDMFLTEFESIPASRFIAPRVEPEIAIVLGRDLSGPGVTVAAAVTAVDFVLPALEIIDSRIRDWKISIADTIADNASSGGVVLGSTPVSLAALALPLVGCNLFRDGLCIDTGAGGAVLGSPILSLTWLANTLGERGVALKAGQVVMPGSLTASYAAAPGSTWKAQFAGIGTVTAVFSGESP